MKNLKKTEKFILKAKKIHGETYDYSLVKYIGAEDKVEIICKKHGVFLQCPHNHLKGCGCRKCGGSDPLTTEIFAKRSTKIHNGKYDYSISKFTGANKKIEILCPIHGSFHQTASQHLMGWGCRECKYETATLSTEEFIERAIKTHGNKYDYEKSIYTTSTENIIITCLKHGEFPQIASNHLFGTGCPDCGRETLSKVNTTTSLESFLDLSHKVHENVYDYSIVKYNGSHKKVIIICKEHGEFKQTPHNHASRKQKCPECNYYAGEKAVANHLKLSGITYEPQKKFDSCKHKYLLRFDFYLPKYNICIEYDGGQHFKPVKLWGGKRTFNIIQRRDKIKTEYCRKNNIPLLRISYKDNIEEKLTSFMCNRIQNKIVY